MTAVRRYQHGPQLLPDGGVGFRLWAPGVDKVDLAVEGQEALAMRPTDGGWFEADAPEAGPGSLYRFRLPDGTQVPDPASRFQPQDVHGPSEVIDPGAFRWTDRAWRGRPWTEAVLYELHVGAFTDEGRFGSIIERLPHLADLGVTAIELMPVADFPGARNWGYDGALPYAPDSAYGRPEDLKAMVDAAHDHGLMVLLDVVYNHFGPDGNFLPAYAPAFFTERHKTPWGAAINYDGRSSRPVRDFAVDNALYWLDEFHLDGLRLDAVHAIIDDSDPPLLAELAQRVRVADWDRRVHLILENEDNEAHWLTPRLYTAQWNDDVHHVLHVAATGDGSGYYADYLKNDERLGRALAEGFAFQGELMPYRGSARGEPSRDLPPCVFIGFAQNHDQVGNRALGERLTQLAAPEAVRAVTAVYLLLPQIPMLFMGEEWDTKRPFPFFCDFEGALGEAVRKGRREEFSRFPEFHDPASRERIPDPQAEATFRAAKLDWDAIDTDALERHRRLLAVRRSELLPLTGKITRGGGYEVFGPAAVRVRWAAGERDLILTANLSAEALQGPTPQGREIWREGEIDVDGRLGPWSVRWAIEDRR